DTDLLLFFFFCLPPPPPPPPLFPYPPLFRSSPAVETVSQMIDFHGGPCHLAPVFHAPGKRIKARVNRAGRAASIVKVHGAKANDGTECALPAEARQRNRKVRIVLKIHSRGSRRGLKLVHGQLLDESH